MWNGGWLWHYVMPLKSEMAESNTLLFMLLRFHRSDECWFYLILFTSGQWVLFLFIVLDSKALWANILYNPLGVFPCTFFLKQHQRNIQGSLQVELIWLHSWHNFDCYRMYLTFSLFYLRKAKICLTVNYLYEWSEWGQSVKI